MGLLDGKVAIITGGGKGIGFGIASAFAEQGASLFITGRTEGRLADAAEKLKGEYGANVAYTVAEGSDEAQVEAAVAKCVEHFGKLDVMVNNAQASKSGTNLIDHTKEDFDLAINTGLYGAFFYMKHAVPELKKTKGCVINLASGAGLFGKPGQSSYAAAKEGIRGLTRVAATEWGKDGINVNVVCPLAWTTQLENFQKAYPEAFKANVKMPPMGHYGDSEVEIGHVCVQLASPDFKFMSGETITLEGGMGQRP